MRNFDPGFIIRPPLPGIWNPADKSAAVGLSADLLTATLASANGGVRSVLSRSGGKLYAELNFSTLTGSSTAGGFASSAANFPQLLSNGNQGFIQYSGFGVYYNTASLFATGSMSGGGILRVAYDAGAHLAWLAFAGAAWNANAAYDPATGNGGVGMTAIDAGGLFLVALFDATADACVINAGTSSFSYPIPTGFTAWIG